jgi:hypothetical protein
MSASWKKKTSPNEGLVRRCASLIYIRKYITGGTHRTCAGDADEMGGGSNGRHPMRRIGSAGGKTVRGEGLKIFN